MKLDEMLRGYGAVISKAGRTLVEFELHFFRDDLRIGKHRHITEGTRQIHGWVLPVSGDVGEQLLLEINDGRKLRFFYEDLTGSIIVSGEIY